MNREQLYRRLALRPTDPEASAAYDQTLQEELEQEVALLVTDLSGFTRITQKRGILHFLSIFRSCVEMALPIIQVRDGRLLKTVADNLIAIFPAPQQAFDAALSLLQAAAASNAQRTEDSQIKICSAIGFGPTMLLEDDCFGDEVNLTFKLGEDIAEPGELLVTASAAELLQANGMPLEGPRSVVTGNVEVVHFAYAEPAQAPGAPPQT